MTRPIFYDIVVVRRSAATERLGIDGKRGVVIGISEPEKAGDAMGFAVAVGAETYMVQEDDLSLTSDRVDRKAIYDGSSLRVTVEGEHAPDDARDDDSGP